MVDSENKWDCAVDGHEMEFHGDTIGDFGVIDGTYQEFWYECIYCGHYEPATSSDIPRFDDDVI